MILVPDNLVHGSEYRGEVYTSKLTVRASTPLGPLSEDSPDFEKLRKNHVEEIWTRLYGDLYRRVGCIASLYEMGYRHEVLLALRDLEKDLLALKGSSNVNGT